MALKKLLFYLIMLSLVIAASELTSYLFLVFHDQKSFSYAAAQEERSSKVALDRDVLATADILALHPYVGYVFEPRETNRRFKRRGLETRISALGFSGNGDILSTDTTDDYVIAVTGGSVAFQFVNFHPGMTVIVEALKERYPDKTINVYTLANGGYKQPQQYLALSYLLALGAHFDMVLNLDGFNEVVLPPVEHIPKRVNPFYPRAWHQKVSGLNDAFMLSTAGKVSVLRNMQVEWAKLCSGKPFRYSATANFLWKVIDQWLSRKITAVEIEFQKHESATYRYEASGPAYKITDEDQLYQDLARVWKNSSLQMHRLCVANGIPYFHFLQPNQYVEGSKPMGPVEIEKAFRKDHEYRAGVIKGYPYLRKAGQELKDTGVNFVDLTMIFKNTPEPLYDDDCCHIGPEGNAILGQAMSKFILEQIDSDKGRGDE